MEISPLGRVLQAKDINMNRLKDFFFKMQEGAPSSVALKKKQAMLLLGGVVGVVGFGLLFLPSTDKRQAVEKKITHVLKPNDVVNAQEIWVDRLEKQAQKAADESRKSSEQNKLLEKKVDVLEQLIAKSHETISPTEGASDDAPSSLNPPPFLSANGAGAMPRYPAQEPFERPHVTPSASPSFSHDGGLSDQEPKAQGHKILHLTRRDLGENTPKLRKTADSYIASGSYAKAVITGACVVGTSVTAPDDPTPIVLRLVGKIRSDNGFTIDMKNAKILGSCRGNISSERALCRLHTLSFTEKNGEIFEKDIEGWIWGEDGQAGLSGIVVDRAGEVAREAMAAGILSGMAGFFKQQTSNSVFPVSPFGQTNALGTQQMLQGGTASGVGSALEKLADFSIKRAEAMQTVLVIHPGRVVNIVFKKGVDLTDTLIRQGIKEKGEDQRLQYAQDVASQEKIQMIGQESLNDGGKESPNFESSSQSQTTGEAW